MPTSLSRRKGYCIVHDDLEKAGGEIRKAMYLGKEENNYDCQARRTVTDVSLLHIIQLAAKNQLLPRHTIEGLWSTKALKRISVSDLRPSSGHGTNAIRTVVTKRTALVRLGNKMLHDDSTYCTALVSCKDLNQGVRTSYIVVPFGPELFN